MGTDQLKELKRLQKENERLRKAEKTLPERQLELRNDLQDHGVGADKMRSAETAFGAVSGKASA